MNMMIEPNIYKRSKTYYIDIRLPNGERIRQSLRTKCREVAENRAASIHYAHQASFYVGAKPLPEVSPEDWANDVHFARADKSHWLYRLWYQARKRFHRKNRSFTLTFEEMREIAIKSGGRCEATYSPLQPERSTQFRANPFAPSIDRINSRDGYHKQNCRLVCYIANLALSDWGDGPFQTMMSYALQQFRGHDYVTISKSSEKDK